MVYQLVFSKQCLALGIAILLSYNEAEGTRTLNLRIDSPIVAFVSTYGYDVYDC